MIYLSTQEEQLCKDLLHGKALISGTKWVLELQLVPAPAEDVRGSKCDSLG